MNHEGTNHDIGESMYVHVFSAYFGLTAAISFSFPSHKDLENKNESSNYNSDLFSMIGTIFLWIYWPSFNAAVARDEGQMRAIVNTYLSIASSCITTFIISNLVGRGKLNMASFSFLIYVFKKRKKCFSENP